MTDTKIQLGTQN